MNTAPSSGWPTEISTTPSGWGSCDWQLTTLAKMASAETHLRPTWTALPSLGGWGGMAYGLQGRGGQLWSSVS